MSFDIPVEILGKQPVLQIYTQISSIYAVPSPSDRPRITATLRTGLERLTAAFPWIAGQVVDKDTVNKSGEFHIVPYEQVPQLTVVDRSSGHDSLPSLEEMAAAKFPARMLDEDLIAPEWTLPMLNPKRKEDAPFPVFLVQVTFIDGGLILTFNTAHTCFDFIGQAHVQYLLSKACQGEPFTEDEIREGNRSRHDVVPLLDDSHNLEAVVGHMIKKPREGDAAARAQPPPKCTWEYFNFSPESLEALKAEATASITSGFVSTDDALTASVWQAVARARTHRLDLTQPVTLTRAVDSRASVGVAKEYPGLLQSQIYYDYMLGDLISAPVGMVAEKLRAGVNQEQIGCSTRAIVTLLNKLEDRGIFSFVANIDPASALCISSWAKPDLYSLEFGLGLGKPASVRRPSFTPVESLAYFAPKSAEKGIAVMISLRDEEMETLRADTVFAKFAEYIG